MHRNPEKLLAALIKILQMLLMWEPILRYIDLKVILCTFKRYINISDAIATFKVIARKTLAQQLWNWTDAHKSIT